MLTGLNFYKSVSSARNNSWPLAIFQPISIYGRRRSILFGQIQCTFAMGQQSTTFKISYAQKLANKVLALTSTTGYKLVLFPQMPFLAKSLFFDLICKNPHVFGSWFQVLKAFFQICIQCGTSYLSKISVITLQCHSLIFSVSICSLT